MTNLINWLLLTIPFSHFIFRKFNIWQAQGYFFQIVILMLFSYRIFKDNKPFGTLIFWLGCITLHLTFLFTKDKSIPVYTILPFLNLVTMAVFYELCISYIQEKNILWLAEKFFYVIMILSVYAILQFFNLDQFYRSIYPDQKFKYVVGTIGNPMHFAHFLAITSPLLFLLKRERMIISLLFCFIAIILTKSATGLICFFIMLFLYFLMRRKKFIFILLMIFTGIFFLISLGIYTNFFADNYRFEMWKKYYEFFLAKPFTGLGLGTVRRIAVENKIMIDGRLLYAHTHSEYLNLLIEGGLIAFSILLWGIYDYFRQVARLPKNDIKNIMILMFVAFLFCSLFGFPAHLWVLAAFGMLAYSYIYRREKDESTFRNKESCSN